MRVIMDLKTEKGKYYIVEVDNISFGIEEIGFIFGNETDGSMLYIFDVPDDGTEVYKILSQEAFEKGTLDLRGYDYRMYDGNTMEEIFDKEE